MKRKLLRRKEEIASNHGLLSTPMVHSPLNVFICVVWKWKILDSEEDAQFLLKQKKNLNDYWPDIIHRALLAILDSRLNKAGMEGAIYVKIDQGAVFVTEYVKEKKVLCVHQETKKQSMERENYVMNLHLAILHYEN